MLVGGIKLNAKQKKVILVLACAVLLIVLLSFLEPGYGHICDKDYKGDPKNCPGYNVVAYALWRFIGVANDYGAAIGAFATIAIGIFTWTLWRSTDRAGEHFRVTERAYVKISHHTPKTTDPRAAALIWVKTAAGKDEFSVDYLIKNNGTTPASVTVTCMTYEVLSPGEKLPDKIDYNPAVNEEKTEAFLVVMDNFTLFSSEEIDATDMAEVIEGKKTLLVFGYVDYIDQFGAKHRGGYGRQLDINSSDKNNLMFPEEYPGLNYDIDV